MGISTDAQRERRGFRMFRGSWRRRRYHVSEGYIRPVAGELTVEYDPLDSSTNDGLPAYLRLVNINEFDDHQIADFCSQFGILGLFQHDLLQVRYTPTSNGAIQCRHDPPPPHYFEVLETPYSRYELDGRGSWPDEILRPKIEDLQRFPADDESFEDMAIEALDQEYLDEWKTDRTKRGLVVVEDVEGIREQPLGGYFRRFFPASGNEFPSLHAPQLWDYLCEPLPAFRTAVLNLRAVFEEWQAGPIGSSRHAGWQTTFLAPALMRARPMPVNGELTWLFPSLLTALYMQLFLDCISARQPRFCANENCLRRAFVADRPDNVFCSDKCRHAQKQRVRRRERTKAKLSPR